MNKKYLYSILLPLFLIGCGPAEVPIDQLTDKKGLKIIKESGEVFTGLAIEFQPDGESPKQIKEYKEGKLDGQIQTWYDNGELKEAYFARHVEREMYKKDRFGKHIKKLFEDRFSEDRKWYENGQMEHEGRFNEEGTKKVGTWVYWYENGQIKHEGQYSDDDISNAKAEKPKREISKTVGEWKDWYENGQLSFVRSFDDTSGKLDGSLKIYCENGTLGVEENHKVGVKVGTHKFWSCDGKDLGQESFVDGKKDAGEEEGPTQRHQAGRSIDPVSTGRKSLPQLPG